MRQKFMQFMRGRYGTDKLNTHLLYFLLVLALLSMIFNINWLIFVWVGIMAFVYYRMFSKQTTKRFQENQAYLYLWHKWRAKVRKVTQRIKDFPKYKYLKCPECKTEMRVPRGRGKIEVKCPKCATKFDAKS